MEIKEHCGNNYIAKMKLDFKNKFYSFTASDRKLFLKRILCFNLTT